jgi:hypothetical protein
MGLHSCAGADGMVVTVLYRRMLARPLSVFFCVRLIMAFLGLAWRFFLSAVEVGP